MKIHTYAAVDIGSNAIRLLINHIYEFENNKYTFNKTSLVRIPVRLGQDAFSTGIISNETIERLSDAMSATRLLMKLYHVEHSKTFATSALRDSKNAQEVIQKVKEKSGVVIELINGEKEAEIILNTHLNSFIEQDTYYLYVDVGGGSTEISLLRNQEVIASKSFKAGTVRFLSGKVNDEFLQKEIKPFVKEITKDKHVELIGSGGNINYIFKLSRYKEGTPLSYNKLKKYHKEISQLTYEQRIEEYNMKPDRADVIVPALTIFCSVMNWSKATKIHIPKIGAADGMIQYMFYNNLKV